MKRLIFILFLVINLMASVKIQARPIMLNNDSIIISNTTNDKYLDTVVYAGIQVLGIKNVKICIATIDNLKLGQYWDKNKFEAFIFNNGNNNYLLSISADVPRSKYAEVIGHELIHLEQYYRGDLIINNTYVIWKGKKTAISIINVLTNYYDRPWEEEAFNGQLDLAEKINNKLKNKMIMKDAIIIEHIDGSFGLYSKNCEEIESGFESHDVADGWALDNGVNIVSSFGDDWVGPKDAMNRKKLRYSIVLEFDDDIKKAGVSEDEVQNNLLNAIIDQVNSSDAGLVGDDAETFTRKITVIDSEGKKIEKTF